VLGIQVYETEAQATGAITDENVLEILKKLSTLAEADLEKRKVYEVVVEAPPE
jgi:hypothetical protein